MEALRMLSKGPGPDYEAEVERLLSCPICLEVYSKPVVILPCQHNLCRKCANDVFQNRGTPMGSGGRFRCPTCRYEVMLDRHGVYGLQRNLLVENIIDMYQSESKKPFRKVEVLMCEDHEDEKINIFCITCQKPTCSLCKVFGDHQNCTVSPVDKVYKDHKSEVSGAIAMLVAGNDKLQTIISKTEEMCTKTEDNSKAVQADICASFDNLYSVLEERKQAMLSRVKALTQEKTEVLQTMLKEFGSQLESSSKLVEEALSLLEEPSAPQFLSVSREMINKVASTARETDVRRPPSDIYKMDMFEVDFSHHSDYLSQINFPNIDAHGEASDEDYETTSTSAESDTASTASKTTGDAFHAKLLLPKTGKTEEVVAAAKVTRRNDDDDGVDSESLTSRSDFNDAERRESTISLEDSKQLGQLDDEVKAIAERYLTGRSSRSRSQASARSDSSSTNDARRRSYSEEKKNELKSDDSITKSTYGLHASRRDSSPMTVTFRPKPTARFQLRPYSMAQSPDRNLTVTSPRSGSPALTQDWRRSSVERQPNNGMASARDYQDHTNLTSETGISSSGGLSATETATTPAPRRRSSRRLARNYATHRRRTWSHLLDKPR